MIEPAQQAVSLPIGEYQEPLQALTNEQVVRRLQQGIEPHSHFELLFRRHHRLVRYVFRRRGCTTEQTEDLLQETFLRVFRGIHRFRHEAQFETWLLRIARSAFSDLMQKRSVQRRSAREVPLEETHHEVDRASTSRGSDTVDPLARALAREQEREVREAILGMPPQMQRCAALRITQGLRYREIADVMQVSIDVVRVQLFRARRRLIKELGGSVGQLRL